MCVHFPSTLSIHSSNKYLIKQLSVALLLWCCCCCCCCFECCFDCCAVLIAVSLMALVGLGQQAQAECTTTRTVFSFIEHVQVFVLCLYCIVELQLYCTNKNNASKSKNKKHFIVVVYLTRHWKMNAPSEIALSLSKKQLTASRARSTYAYCK